MQTAQFKFDYPVPSPSEWAVVQVTQDAEHVFTVSAWVEDEHGAFDALYGFLQDYVLQSHGGQICFESMEDAISFVRDSMNELGFSILKKPKPRVTFDNPFFKATPAKYENGQLVDPRQQ